MAITARALNWLANLNHIEDPHVRLVISENKTIKKAETAEVSIEENQNVMRLFMSTMEELFGIEIIEQKIEFREEVEISCTNGTALTKEKIYQWMKNIVSDSSFDVYFLALNALGSVKTISPDAKLIFNANENKFIDGSNELNEADTNRATIRAFRQQLFHLYGQTRVEKHSAVGPVLNKMIEKGHALTKLMVIKVLLTVSDMTVSDVRRGFNQSKIAEMVLLSELSDDAKLALLCLTMEDDTLAQKYVGINEQGNLEINSGAIIDVETWDLISPKKFEELLLSLSPIKDIHDLSVGDSADSIESTWSKIWSKLVYGSDWGPWLGKKAEALYHRIKIQKEVDELPGETPELKSEAYRELLAKEIAYLEITEGTLIPAPNSSKGSKQYYQVAKEVVSDDGLVAYILKPAIPEMNELKDVVLFRGTSFGLSGLVALSTLIADVEPHIGNTAFKSACDELFTAMKEHIRGESVEFIGHSFGTVMAQRTLNEWVAQKLNEQLDGTSLEHVSDIRLALFNPPAIEKSTTDKFSERMNNADDLHVHLDLYKTTGDSVHFVGEEYIGSRCDRQKVSVQVVVCSGKGIDAHLSRFFSKNGVDIEDREVQRITDERVEALLNNHDNVCIERMRQIFGFIVYIILRIIRFFLGLCCGTRDKPVSFEEKELMRLASQGFMDQVQSLVTLLNLIQSEAPGEESQIRAWVSEKLDDYFAAQIGLTLDPVSDQIVEKLLAREMKEVLDELTFAHLAPGMDDAKIAEFKRAIKFDESTSQVLVILKDEITKRNTPSATQEENRSELTDQPPLVEELA